MWWGSLFRVTVFLLGISGLKHPEALLVALVINI